MPESDLTSPDLEQKRVLQKTGQQEMLGGSRVWAGALHTPDWVVRQWQRWEDTGQMGGLGTGGQETSAWLSMRRALQM